MKARSESEFSGLKNQPGRKELPEDLSEGAAY